jgi:hypothetical protein
MSDQSETVLGQSLDAVDQLRRRAFVGAAFIILLSLGVFVLLLAMAVESRAAPAAIKLLYAASVLQVIVIALCTAVIQLSMTRMTRMILRAIELMANGSSRE